MSESEDKPARMRVLGARALERGELARPNLFARVPNDTLPEDVLKPGYWQNHIAVLSRHAHAEITVVREDSSMILKLLCTSAAPGLAHMHVLYRFVNNENLDLPETEDTKLELPDGYKTVNIAQGENKGWQVRYGINADILAQRIATRKAAVVFAITHAEQAGTLPKQAQKALETT